MELALGRLVGLLVGQYLRLEIFSSPLPLLSIAPSSSCSFVLTDQQSVIVVR